VTLTRRDGLIAALLVALSLGVYGFVMGPYLRGYDSETAAVSEGIARGLGAEVPEDTDLYFDPGEPGRVGILQPLLMVPFYGAGAALDEIDSSGEEYTFRSFTARIYTAFITALTVGLLFCLVRMLGRSEAWALAIALLYAFASFAFPYASIGMEPTSTLTVMLAFVAALLAARSPRPSLFALTSLVVGLSASTRPSTFLPACAAFVLLWPAIREAGRDQRLRLVGALAAPLVLAGIAFLAYNLSRYDDPFQAYSHDVIYHPRDFPDALIGLFLSPGKGLLWYSPLVILGGLGLIAMWRRERIVATALAAGILLGAVPFLVDYWSDDTWGPRYLVSVAWMGLIPIAWWASTHTRRLVLAGVAAIALWIQLAGTFVSFTDQSSALISQERTGVPVYGNYAGVPDESIPYGDDPVRWVPELSPIYFHSKTLISFGTEAVGLGERTITYAPFRGRDTTVGLGWIEPFVWWNPNIDTLGIPSPSAAWLIPFGGLAIGGGWGLWRIRAGRRLEAPERTPPQGS
jgi:hypothetical protein